MSSCRGPELPTVLSPGVFRPPRGASHDFHTGLIRTTASVLRPGAGLLPHPCWRLFISSATLLESHQQCTLLALQEGQGDGPRPVRGASHPPASLCVRPVSLPGVCVSRD